jgi:hypothetical protein
MRERKAAIRKQALPIYEAYRELALHAQWLAGRGFVGAVSRDKAEGDVLALTNTAFALINTIDGRTPHAPK